MAFEDFEHDSQSRYRDPVSISLCLSWGSCIHPGPSLALAFHPSGAHELRPTWRSHRRKCDLERLACWRSWSC